MSFSKILIGLYHITLKDNEISLNSHFVSYQKINIKARNVATFLKITEWRLCKMNLAIRGIDGNIGPYHADTFTNDLHKDLKAGYILANGSMSSNTGGEEGIRKNIIEADLVDCMISLPGQLFYTTRIPACLWFITRNKKNSGFRDRKGETLFIDARKMGHFVDRIYKELSDEEINRIGGAPATK